MKEPTDSPYSPAAVAVLRTRAPPSANKRPTYMYVHFACRTYSAQGSNIEDWHTRMIDRCAPCAVHKSRDGHRGQVPQRDEGGYTGEPRRNTDVRMYCVSTLTKRGYQGPAGEACPCAPPTCGPIYSAGQAKSTILLTPQAELFGTN